MIVYDATQFNNKPAGLLPGCSPITMLYGFQLWPNGAKQDQLPARDLVESLVAGQDGVICVDVESWLYTNPVSFSLSIRLLKMIREFAPLSKVGWYDMPQCETISTDSWWGPYNVYRSRDNIKQIRGPLKGLLDLYFPCMYGPGDADQWQQQADHNLWLTGQFLDMVPFLCPGQSGGGPNSPTTLTGLKYCKTNNLACVLWCGPSDTLDVSSDWYKFLVPQRT